MWELDYKESWAPKIWCFWTVVLEKTLKNPLDCKEIQPVHPKEDQSWVFIGRIDVEAETPILWPPYVKSWLIWKDPDVGKGWGQEEKRMAEDETVGWYLWLNRHGFGWTLGVGDGQGGLVCCGSWGHKELEMTEWLNWTELTQSQDTQGEWQGKDQGEPMTLFPCESKDLTRRRTYGVVSFGRLASSRPRMSQRFSSNPKTGKSQCPILKAVK